MQKLARILVKHRLTFFVLSVCLAIILSLFIGQVNINKDLSKYLDPESNMAQGLEIMNKEFPATTLNDTFQIMFTGLTPSEKVSIYNELSSFEGVDSITYDIASEAYNSKTHTMYVVNTQYSMDDAKVNKIITNMTNHYQQQYEVQTFYSNGYMNVLDLLIPMAVVLMLIILFVMCRAYIEPLLILCAIAVAILINMGSNIMFESVSDMTFSIAAVLQLVLSIDYSIMLIHRFVQEDKLLNHSNPEKAMENAVANAMPSVMSSATTTVVGLIVLVLMSFTIGQDIGLVLSKGIALSFICVFTVLPSLILWCYKLMYSTEKSNVKEWMARRRGGVSHAE